VSVILRERYRLEHRLGSGGAADVHRATDTTLQRPVAVKVLRDVAGDDSTRDRFVTEARTLASVSHRNIVMVLDAGIGDDDDKPFLVMELVEGRTLADALRDGPLASPEVARIGAELAAGLSFAHERLVVHRDVKPGNVLLSDAGPVKLADFGIARLIGDTVRHTRTGTAIGTAAYLSPEQVRGEQVTGAADVYALGLVLLEALTGTRAFPGSATEAALARLHRDPDVPVDLPGGWTPLLLAMTAAEPATRPTAAEVARRLREVDGAQVQAGSPDDPTTTALLTAPVATAPITAGAPGRTLDRAGDAIARTPGLLLARWRGLEPHQRGVAGALAALVLLILVTALAAGASTPSGDRAPAPASSTPAGSSGSSDPSGPGSSPATTPDPTPTTQAPVPPVGIPPGQVGKGPKKDKAPKPKKPKK
jgi:serine/threonine protein kinase